MNKQQLEAKLQLLETEMILAKGGTQKEVREKFGDTLGQKLYGITQLNKRFPNVKLVHRMTELDPTDRDWIKFKDISGSHLPNLLMRSNSDELKAQNQKRRALSQEEYSPLTEEKFQEFITSCTVKVNCAKIMNRSNMEHAASTYPIGIVRDVFNAILSNNMDVLKKYAERAAVIDGVVEAIMKTY